MPSLLSGARPQLFAAFAALLSVLLLTGSAATEAQGIQEPIVYGGSLSPSRIIPLAELIQRSDEIVRATVKSSGVGAPEGLGDVRLHRIALNITQDFLASHASHTKSDRTLTIFQMPVAQSNVSVGDDVLWFVAPQSSIGLTAPLGLTSGDFRITKDAGELMVKNLRDNRGLWGTSLWDLVSPDDLKRQLASMGRSDFEHFEAIANKPCPLGAVPYDLIAAVIKLRRPHR